MRHSYIIWLCYKYISRQGKPWYNTEKLRTFVANSGADAEARYQQVQRQVGQVEGVLHRAGRCFGRWCVDQTALPDVVHRVLSCRGFLVSIIIGTFWPENTPRNQILCKCCDHFQGLMPIRWLATRTSQPSYFQSARCGERRDRRQRILLQLRRCSTFRRALTKRVKDHQGEIPKEPWNLKVPPSTKHKHLQGAIFLVGSIRNHHKIPKQLCAATAHFKNHV